MSPSIEDKISPCLFLVFRATETRPYYYRSAQLSAHKCKNLSLGKFFSFSTLSTFFEQLSNYYSSFGENCLEIKPRTVSIIGTLWKIAVMPFTSVFCTPILRLISSAFDLLPGCTSIYFGVNYCLTKSVRRIPRGISGLVLGSRPRVIDMLYGSNKFLNVLTISAEKVASADAFTVKAYRLTQTFRTTKLRVFFLISHLLPKKDLRGKEGS